MLGTNPIRKPFKGDGSVLDVQEVFATLQGEGPFSGRPAVFIRLGGCNLACSFCDTEFENFSSMPLDTLLNQVDYYANTVLACSKLVVISGGEPFRQPIAALCKTLLEKQFTVQIETNGTLYQPLPKAVHIVCSPKNTGTGYHPLRDDLLSHCHAIKFIVSASQTAYQSIAEIGQSRYLIPVYIQPMDEQDAVKNRYNTAHAIQLVKQHNAILSLQTHKIIGIP